MTCRQNKPMFIFMSMYLYTIKIWSFLFRGHVLCWLIFTHDQWNHPPHTFWYFFKTPDSWLTWKYQHQVQSPVEHTLVNDLPRGSDYLKKKKKTQLLTAFKCTLLNIFRSHHTLGGGGGGGVGWEITKKLSAADLLFSSTDISTKTFYEIKNPLKNVTKH